jgi:hypothetical protein
MQNITHSLGIIFPFLYVKYYIISAVTNQICRIDPNDGIWGFWHNAPKRGISGFMKVKGVYWQCSLQSRVQAAIYLRHLPDDLVHVDRLGTSVELKASEKMDMLPGNRRDIAEPGSVFNISGAVQVVQKT